MYRGTSIGHKCNLPWYNTPLYINVHGISMYYGTINLGAPLYIQKCHGKISCYILLCTFHNTHSIVNFFMRDIEICTENIYIRFASKCYLNVQH